MESLYMSTMAHVKDDTKIVFEKAYNERGIYYRLIFGQFDTNTIFLTPKALKRMSIEINNLLKENKK
ncbi:MAG: hypothetical protein GY853_05865 [PVC group bacterium]|nr:hypothetical protein [PVC group bacterium]